MRSDTERESDRLDVGEAALWLDGLQVRGTTVVRVCETSGDAPVLFLGYRVEAPSYSSDRAPVFVMRRQLFRLTEREELIARMQSDVEFLQGELDEQQKYHEQDEREADMRRERDATLTAHMEATAPRFADVE